LGPKAGLDGCGKSCPYRAPIPEPFIPWPVAIPAHVTVPM
jgi:hypothetical protein